MVDTDDLGAASQEKRVARRVARPQAPVMGAAILADTSSSMEMRDGAGWLDMSTPRRIDRLAKVLDYFLRRVRVQALIAFADMPVEIPLIGQVALPEPGGSTNLALALSHVLSLTPRPTQVFVLSDGRPNSEEEAFGFALKLRPSVINAYYVGPDNDRGALTFMAKLAACGGAGGKSGHFDMIDPALLGSEIHGLLLSGPRG